MCKTKRAWRITSRLTGINYTTNDEFAAKDVAKLSHITVTPMLICEITGKECQCGGN